MPEIGERLWITGQGIRCQEASLFSTTTYIPCGRPAVAIVKTRDPKAYAMCDSCADHNVRHRRARYILVGEPYDLFNGGSDAR